MEPLVDRLVQGPQVDYDGGLDEAERDPEQEQCCEGPRQAGGTPRHASTPTVSSKSARWTSSIVVSSVEVPAVRPTVPTPANHSGSRSDGLLDMHGGHAPLAAERDELAGVVRIPAADDHHRVHLVEQPFERPLVLLGRQADCVDELDLGLGVAHGDRRADLRDRRRAEAVVWQTIPSRREGYARTSSSDPTTSKRSRSSTIPSNLDVSATADHQDMIALVVQRPGRLVDPEDQRAGRVHQPLARLDQRGSARDR